MLLLLLCCSHLSKDVARLRRFVPDLLIAFLADHDRVSSGAAAARSNGTSTGTSSGAGGSSSSTSSSTALPGGMGMSDFCEAACVCLDISGFSALSEKLCVQGEAGLDDLVAVINSCMGRCEQQQQY
jgi:hypothetical protein